MMTSYSNLLSAYCQHVSFESEGVFFLKKINACVCVYLSLLLPQADALVDLFRACSIPPPELKPIPSKFITELEVWSTTCNSANG